VLETRYPQAILPAGDLAPAPPLKAVRPDVRSIALALCGTFVLRFASYAAGLMIGLSFGLKSRTEVDVTVGLAALVQITFYVPELLASPILGTWSDRYGRKLFMVLGPVLGGLAAALMGFASLIPILVLVRVLQGFSTASATPATLGFFSAQTAASVRLRGRVMGFYEAATVVGLALGGTVGGLLWDRFGTTAFLLVTLVYGVALAPFLLVRDPIRSEAERARRHGLLARMFNRRIMRFAPAWLAANAVLGAWFTAGPFLAATAPNKAQFLMRGFNGSEIGLAYLVFGILFTGGALTWGFLMPWLGRQMTLLIGVGGLAFTSVMLWLLNHVPVEEGHVLAPLLVAGIIVGIFVESGFTPAALAYLAEIAEEHAEDRGSVMGVYSVLLSVGQLLGGFMAAPFAERLGINGLILLTGLLCLVALFTVMLLGQAERRYRRRAKAAAAAA
jgi:MFS family permease